MNRPCCGSSLQAHFESSGEFRGPLWGVNCRGRLLMNRCFWEGPLQANFGNPGEVWGHFGELIVEENCLKPGPFNVFPGQG